MHNNTLVTVQLPEDLADSNLHYTNILCGVVRGALEMVTCESIFPELSRNNSQRETRTKQVTPGLALRYSTRLSASSSATR